MTCQELAQLVTDYWEGALAAPERSALERHLSLCPACVNFVEQMRATVEATGRVPVEAITPEIEEKLLAGFRAWKTSRSR